MTSALLVWLSAERCFAQTATFEVPAECGDEAGFESELARLAGTEAPRTRPSLLRIVREGDGTYRLTLVFAGRTRELEHADCGVLLRSAAVIVAASLKAEAAAEPAPASTPALAKPRAEEAPPAPATVAEPAPRESDAARASRVHGNLAAGVGVAAGFVPGVTGALELRGGVLGELFGASLGVRYFPNQSAMVEGRRVDVWGLGFRPAAVVAPWPGFDVSLGLDVDLLSGRGSGVISRSERDSAWTVAPSAELALIPLRNRHLALELAAEGRVALVRPVFLVTGFQDLYRVPSWGMVLVLRGAWHFP